MEFTEQKLGWGNDICNPTSRTLLQQFNYRPKSLRLKKKKKKKLEKYQIVIMTLITSTLRTQQYITKTK